MQIARRAEVLQDGDVPVQKLQDKVVDALQPATRSRIGRVARQLLQFVVDPAHHPIGPSVDGRVRTAQQDGRYVFLIEHDLPVADLKNARNAETGKPRLDRLAQLEGEPRNRDI